MIRWRAYEAGDRATVVGMMRRLYIDDPSDHVVTDEQIGRTITTLTAEPVRGRIVVAAEAEPEGGLARPPVGYAVLCGFWSNELGGEVCIVDELYVAPPARGAGLASSLLTELVARRAPWFRAAVAFELEVTPTNTRARALDTRLGFRPTKNARLRCRP
ncbi:MAG: GNAT family N-acetyltransferase [Kofleriaceae bacterium]|nr:GNAT family N-acetyltransferase [Kofleriaceae bacterium]